MKPRMLRAILLAGLFATLSSPAFAQSLTGTNWAFTQIGGELLDAQDRQRTQLQFDEKNGRMSATAGCNRMSGPYTQSGPAIAFGQIAMTRMACPPPLAKRESNLVDALGGVRSWRIVEGNLILADANGAALLRLFAAGRK